MARVLSICPPSVSLSRVAHHHNSSGVHFDSSRHQLAHSVFSPGLHQSWTSLQRTLRCKPKYTCLFSDNRKQEQARKALESALGGKKSEFEKWDKEIKRREEAGGGSDSGGGGWFRWDRWFGGSDGDGFWQESQQIGLTILGIVAMYLIVAKGDLILAVIFNPLLFLLRGPRNGLYYLTSRIMRKAGQNSNGNVGNTTHLEVSQPVSAKESVVRKWGSD